jgi:hypothetical protein
MPLLNTVLGVLVTVVVVILLWKIFKKVIGAVIIGVILLAFLWFIGIL